MLGGKKVTDFTSLFSPYDFKKTDNIILSEISKIKLSKQTKFPLSEIIGTIFIKRLIKGNHAVEN